ncbi:MAG: hypothetical protein WC404_00285, partial [Candidatus Omnitrophota bacterium]
MKKIIPLLAVLLICSSTQAADDWAMRWPSGTQLQVITPTTLAGYGYLTPLTGLTLDQTTHQHVINDYPRFDAGIGLVGNYGLYWRDVADANTIAYISYDGDLTMRAVTGDLKFVAGGGDIDFADDNILTTGTLGVGAVTSTGTSTFQNLNVTNSAGTTLTDTAVVNIRQNDAFDAVYRYSNVGVLTNDNTVSAKTTSGSFTVFATTGQYCLIGKTAPFTEIYVDIQTASTAGRTLTFQYSNGVGTWDTLAVTDGTTAFTIDGSITFTAPAGWVTDTYNASPQYYWVKITTTNDPGTDPTANIIVPSSKSPFQVFPQAGDATPAIYFSKYGPYVGIGYANESNINGNSLYTASSIFAAAGDITSQNQNIKTTSTDGFILVNSQTTSGTFPVQMSPRLKFSGRAWDGSASKAEQWIEEVTPIAGASPTTSYLAWSHASNSSASYTEDMRLTSGGNLFLGTTDTDGTPATGRLVVKGSTNDGSTNIFVGRDSDEVNVATLDSNGLLTNGVGTYVDYNTFDGQSAEPTLIKS